MNWFDYTRGYDDGMAEGRSNSDNSNLLFTLFQLAFSILILLLRLAWGILIGLLGFLWAMGKLIAATKR